MLQAWSPDRADVRLRVKAAAPECVVLELDAANHMKAVPNKFDIVLNETRNSLRIEVCRRERSLKRANRVVHPFSKTGAPYDRLTTPTALLDSAVVIEVIDPATGVSLAGHGTAIFGSSQFYQVGTFTVPASGTFTLRARVYGEWGYAVGLTAYEFFVKRGP